MSLRPQLNVLCGRCGKPRGLVHECVSNSRRRQTLKPTVTFGKCPNCKKTITNPLTHVCAPKSDFKSRKRKHEKEQRAAAAKKRPKQGHDYTTCADNHCPRSLCVAFKTGFEEGDHKGFDRGWQQGQESGFKEGYDKGFPDGIAACPRDHK
jgi:hypothetical protein